jgi:hypothetical protein
MFDFRCFGSLGDWSLDSVAGFWFLFFFSLSDLVVLVFAKTPKSPLSLARGSLCFFPSLLEHTFYYAAELASNIACFGCILAISKIRSLIHLPIGFAFVGYPCPT